MNLEQLLTKTTPQLAYLTVQELREACKVLEIKGYSKLKKAELLEAVTTVHTSLVSRHIDIAINEMPAPSKEIMIEAVTYEYCSVAHLEKLFLPKDTPEEFQATIPSICQQLLLDLLAVYSATSIISQLTKKMIGSTSYRLDVAIINKGSLDLMRFHERDIDDQSSRTLIKETWKQLLKPLRVAVKERYLAEVARGISPKHEKVVVDNLGAVSWAKTNLDSSNPLALGFALAILSGRRLVEIFGSSDYTVCHEDFIQIAGVAKSKEVNKAGVFVPLCPASEWMAAMERLSPNRIAGSIEVDGEKVPNPRYEKLLNTMTKHCSRQLKIIYDSLGLKSFKDARDIYAVTCYATINLNSKQTEQSRILKNLLCHSGSDAVDFYKKYQAQPLPELQPLFDRYAVDVASKNP